MAERPVTTIEQERDRLSLLVHEVRSPVAALVAIAEALRQDALDVASTPELIRLALGACSSIERVVGDAAVGSLRLEKVEVGSLVEDASAAAVLGGARVRTVVERGLPAITADSVRLRQALDNLIANARIHSSSEEEIVVAAKREQSAVVVSVSDLGHGIPRESHDAVLERGARLDPSEPGSGWGLSVVRAVAEAHGGTVRVASESGAGATFTISIPLQRS